MHHVPGAKLHCLLAPFPLFPIVKKTETRKNGAGSRGKEIRTSGKHGAILVRVYDALAALVAALADSAGPTSYTLSFLSTVGSSHSSKRQHAAARHCLVSLLHRRHCASQKNRFILPPRSTLVVIKVVSKRLASRASA